MKISFGFFGATYFSKRYFILNSSKMIKKSELRNIFEGNCDLGALYHQNFFFVTATSISALWCPIAETLPRLLYVVVTSEWDEKNGNVCVSSSSTQL